MVHSPPADSPALFRVSMRDIDLYGHVHNSVYMDYCEDAVVDFLRRRSLLGHFRHRQAGVAYHVKKAEVVFHTPLDIDDEVEPRVRVQHLGRSSIVFAIELVRRRDGAAAASGQLVWVCVDLAAGKPVPVPEATRAGLAG